MFIQSDRLSRFLRFTVEATLAGEADTLKEYLIGTEVYDRKPPYHPGADSIVRSEARRLRNKLREYYESVGKDDSVLIDYRPGSYVPTFRNQRSLHDDRIAADRALGELFTEELGAQAFDVPLVPRRVDVQIVFDRDRARATSSFKVINADQLHTRSKRFETESDTQSRFAVSEKIASTLISRIRSDVTVGWERALIGKT